MTKAPVPERFAALMAPQEPGAPARLINGQRPTHRSLIALVRRLAFLAASDAYLQHLDRIYGQSTAKRPAEGEREP